MTDDVLLLQLSHLLYGKTCFTCYSTACTLDQRISAGKYAELIDTLPQLLVVSLAGGAAGSTWVPPGGGDLERLASHALVEELAHRGAHYRTLSECYNMGRVSLLLCSSLQLRSDQVKLVCCDSMSRKLGGAWTTIRLLYLTLKRINIEKQGIISSCKLEMLSAWLQRQDNVVQKGVPSWSVLRTALQSMGEHETADRISNWWWVVSTSLWVCVVPLIQEQEEEGISTTQPHTVSDTGHYYTMIIDYTLCY